MDEGQIAAILNCIADRLGLKLEEVSFDVHLLRSTLLTDKKVIRYVHLKDTMKISVASFYASLPGIPQFLKTYPENLQLDGRFMVLTYNKLMTLKPAEFSVEGLASQIDRRQWRQQQNCFVCNAFSRYISEDKITQQCLFCTAQVCRACVRGMITECVGRYKTYSHRKQTKTIIELQNVCPRCPNCHQRRLGDVYIIQSRILEYFNRSTNIL